MTYKTEKFFANSEVFRPDTFEQGGFLQSVED
jgi:hypothetical protein